jgi:hypothetical protein
MLVSPREIDRGPPDRAALALYIFAFGESGADDEARTRDLNLGKVALYQLSYVRLREEQ